MRVYWLRVIRIGVCSAVLVVATLLSRSVRSHSDAMPSLALAGAWAIVALLLFTRAAVAERELRRNGGASGWADLYWGLAVGASLAAVLIARG